MVYEPLSDKIKSVLFYLFNLIGDESKNTVSYKRFRKILYRNRNSLKIEISSLPEDILSILKDFNNHRNWGLHIPESLFIGKRKLLKIDSDLINTVKLHIPIPVYDNYEIKFLQNLSNEVSETLNLIEKVEKQVMKDYSSLVGEEFSLHNEIQKVKPYALMGAVQTSMNIQTGKTHNK